jgi:hypothetical protein
MKKIVFGILVSMLMIGSVLASATIVENEVELKEEKTSLFEIEDGEISATIAIGNYEIENTEQGDEIFVENFGHLLIPGKPNVPSRIFSIAIPPGAEFVDFSFEVTDSEALVGSYNLPPVPVPEIIGEENQEAYMQELEKYNDNYKQTYGSDDPYPSSNVEFVQTAGQRRYNLVDVRVIPFTYHPISGELIYHSEISIDISYTFPEGFNPDEIMIDDVPRAEQLAEKIIYNYDQAQDWYPVGAGIRETYDFVIITLDSLVSKIEPLVEWEENQGNKVYVATTDWVDSHYDGYDLAEKMRNFLRDKYPSEKWGILDVCLIGGYDDVPIRYTAQNCDTDYYYAELSKPDSESWDKDGDHRWGESSDPIDFHTEVNVGRIPWSDGSIVEHICEKTVAYEQNFDPAFKKNVLLIGTFFWPDTDNAVLMELKSDPEENPWMADFTKTTMYEYDQTQYKEQCDYDISYAKVREVWSEGSYAFVNYAGHGSPTACYEYYPSQPFVDTDTCNYLNDDYPAIIFAAACSNSDTRYDNIGQMMMKQGGIGFLGATAVAYGYHGWNDPYDGATASLDYFFFTKCTSGDYTQGEAHQWGLLEMYTHDLWYYTYLEMFEWGALWGNPGLTMGTVSRPPEKPTKPDGPEEWAQFGETEFTSSSTDPDGHGIYYLFDWGDGTDSGWLGPYGSGQTCAATNSWDVVGEFEVKVIAQDEFGVSSEWSDPHTITIVENEPPEKPTIIGPKTGAPGVLLTFKVSAEDPEGHDVSYMVTWGDGHYVPYTEFNPSGQEVTFSHSWNERGDYTVVAKAKDKFGAINSERKVHRPSLI